MQVLSVNVGQPREVLWKGKAVQTGIFKAPVPGPVAVLAEQLAGDGQADRRVHGGLDKAVYAYDLRHYAFWQEQLPTVELTAGIFGENLTTNGLLEHTVCLGDTYTVGTAVLMAVQPRLPCVKLGIRFGDEQMPSRFQRARRSGIYFRVLQPGTVQAGDAITLLEPARVPISLQEIVDQYTLSDKQPDRIAAILALPLLPAFFRESFGRMLAAVTAPPA